MEFLDFMLKGNYKKFYQSLKEISKKNGKKSALIWDLDTVVRERDWTILECTPDETERIRNSSWLDDKESGTVVVWEVFDQLEKEIRELIDLTAKKPEGIEKKDPWKTFFEKKGN